MIQLAKKPLYNFISIASLIFFLICSLSVIVIGRLSLFLFFPLLIFFLVLYFLFRRLNSKISSKYRDELEKLEEKINLLTQEIIEKNKVLESLPAKCARIDSLFDVAHELVELYNPEKVLNFLIDTSRKLFPSAENVLLFLLHKNSLALKFSFKKSDCVIKEKSGDIIERWLLKHNQSLLIEDLLKEFRFDYNKVAAFRERKIRSIVASPLSIGDNILGAMRIESKEPVCFSMDDSRLLRDICDLGAVVLERANLFLKAEELAIRDSLTALFLKDYFFRRTEEELKRCKYKNTNLGIIMLDIDDFKKINDMYGHIVGDIVLRRLAKILNETLGSAGNIISRFGGEEFMVSLIECDKNSLFKTAESLRANIEKDRINFRRKNINFTVSVGAVFYPDDGLELVDLISKVDKYLYKAKKEGKNRLCYTGL